MKHARILCLASLAFSLMLVSCTKEPEPPVTPSYDYRDQYVKTYECERITYEFFMYHYAHYTDTSIVEIQVKKAEQDSTIIILGKECHLYSNGNFDGGEKSDRLYGNFKGDSIIFETWVGSLGNYIKKFYEGEKKN